MKLIQLENDPYWTLDEWSNTINTLIIEYGNQAKLFCDGGPNNVILTLEIKECKMKSSLKEEELLLF